MTETCPASIGKFCGCIPTLWCHRHHHRLLVFGNFDDKWSNFDVKSFQVMIPYLAFVVIITSLRQKALLKPYFAPYGGLF